MYLLAAIAPYEVKKEFAEKLGQMYEMTVKRLIKAEAEADSGSWQEAKA